jgi:hypothetical protein
MFRAILASLLLITPAFAQDTKPISFTGYPLFAKAITPHNDNNLTNYTGAETAQYVFVGVTGNVVCLPAGNPDGSTVTFSSLEAGSFVPVLCRRVLATGTTATGLIGIF